MDVAREVVGYTLISLVALAASSAGTGWVDGIARQQLAHQHALRVMLVTLAYVAVQGLLFVAKFVAYDRWVFTERRPLPRRAQGTSRWRGRRARGGIRRGGVRRHA